MLRKILIANRGEIACRIIHTAKRLGIETVLIYSQIDQNSLAVSLADEAYPLEGSLAKDTYLNIEAILAIAQKTACDGVHPGYGFLSENPNFSKSCHEAGLIFIGPSFEVMAIMGDKIAAKKALSDQGIPLLPGYHGDEENEEKLLKHAQNIGFPVIIKAAHGGGGKALHWVKNQSAFKTALENCRRETWFAYQSKQIFIEKYLVKPRHFEVQIIADQFGTVLHLFERDCSLQRRHQKIIEEAPIPQINPALCAELRKTAIHIAKSFAYQGAGTIEFLIDQNQSYYFLEMNTRLQVEHPVTEMITGIDLVEWQIRIASGEPLPRQEKDIQCTGHAIECRIYAEDPKRDFLPATGMIEDFLEPSGVGLRLDSGIKRGDFISEYYDPLLAKLIAHGPSREDACVRMEHALNHYHIAGIKTNIDFLRRLIKNPDYRQGLIHTQFLDDYIPTTSIESAPLALYFAAALDYLSLNNPDDASSAENFSWQINTGRFWFFDYVLADEIHSIQIAPINANSFSFTWKDHRLTLFTALKKQRLIVKAADHQWQAWVPLPLLSTSPPAKLLNFFTQEGELSIRRHTWEETKSDTPSRKSHTITSPMPARIMAVLKQEGDAILTGEPLIVIESMKMEYTLKTPRDGIIVKVHYQTGDKVAEDAVLISLQNE